MMPPFELLSGDREGPFADLSRGALGCLSRPYTWAVNWRNRRFDSGSRNIVRLDRPVISVGNITTGGTGKTPLCIWLAERLLEIQLCPAVVSRGYHAEKGVGSDEMQVISRRVPGAVCVANPQRIAAAELAIEECGAEVIILDDGFQHRGLARDVDIVLIDATLPFGFGHLLPRGLLREPLANLGRADLLIVTHADQVGSGDLRSIIENLNRLAPGAPTARCQHTQTALISLNGAVEPNGPPPASRIFLTAGIGNPRSFRDSVLARGVDVVGACWWPDHHRYRSRDVEFVLKRAEHYSASAVFTTEKDLVKLQDLSHDWRVPVYALRVDIEFLEEDAEIVLDPIRRLGQNPTGNQDET